MAAEATALATVDAICQAQGITTTLGCCLLPKNWAHEALRMYEMVAGGGPLANFLFTLNHAA
jgi:hypothetical protein